jgi:Fe-S-cluster containining protein
MMAFLDQPIVNKRNLHWTKMDTKKDKWDENFLIVALKEEARKVLWDVESPADHETLIESVLDDLQALAPREDGEETRTEEEIMAQVRERLLKAAYATRPYCIRCGTCCEKGSPTLLEEDITLFTGNVLKPEHVFTIREGEMVYSSLKEDVEPATEEMIKIKEKPDDHTCLFFRKQGKVCSIYDTRPQQCRAQECWNPGSAEQISDKPRLNRSPILQPTGALWDIIQRHEDRCSHRKFTRVMTRLRATKGQTVHEVLELLSYDEHVRSFVAERFNLDEDTLDFFLGRSLRESLAQHGLMVQDQPDGSFLLIAIEPEAEQHD